MIDNHGKSNMVQAAFDRQSEVFDDYEKGNATLIWMRSVIHRHMDEYIHPAERLLDLNAGTGIDALHFARKGLTVHALDVSAGMLGKLKEKSEKENLSEYIFPEQKSFADLSGFADRQFNHIFSNFGGMNFVDEPENVVSQFARILVPGGTVTLIVMPPVCPWELAASLRGRFGFAFRRFKKDGARANVEGIHFRTYYHSPSRLKKCFGRDYSTVALRGLCAIVPPPNFDGLSTRYPKLLRSLTALDEKLCMHAPFTSWADHYILTMRYNPK